MATEPAVSESGTVKLGDVEALATWHMGAGDRLVIQFDETKLTPEGRATLEHYRHVSQPMPVKIPGTRKKLAAIIGYNPKDGTFYLSLAGG